MATAIFLANNIQGATDSDALGLDAVEDFTVTRTAQATNHPTVDGSNITDHYFHDPLTARFSGVVSPWNFTGQGTDLTPEEFIRQVNNQVLDKKIFDLVLSDDLQSIPSCIITNFEYSREAKEGKSVLVNVTIQQIERVTQAELAEVDDFALADSVAEQGQRGQEKGDERSNTYLGGLFVSGGKVIDVQNESLESLGFVVND